jgi:hypothetical protein
MSESKMSEQYIKKMGMEMTSNLTELLRSKNIPPCAHLCCDEACEIAYELARLDVRYVDIRTLIIDIQYILNGGNWVKEWGQLKLLFLKLKKK